MNILIDQYMKKKKEVLSVTCYMSKELKQEVLKKCYEIGVKDGKILPLSDFINRAVSFYLKKGKFE